MMIRPIGRRVSHPHGGRGARLGGALSVLSGVSLIAMAMFPGVLTAVAASAPDVGNAGVFELDGNIAQNAATPPPYDWSCVFETPASTGCPPPSTLMVGSVFTADYANPDPTYFNSNKDIQDVGAWGCGPLNNPLSKDDILNAYGAAFVPTTGPKADHLLLYLAQERGSANGDSFAGFWLMRQQHACVNGAFTNGGHDVGDILVVSNYTNGGSSATVQLYEWDPASPQAVNNLVALGSGFTCGMTPPAGVTDPNDICGIANSSTITEPWAPHAALAANQFVEVGLDITDLLPPPMTEAGACFSDFLAETRSSQELTATLKDFATGRLHFCVSPTVTTKQTTGGVASAATTVEPGAVVSDQAFLGAPISGTPGGTITYNLYADTSCATTPIFTSGPKTVSGLGAGGALPASDPYTIPSTLALGTYQWQAVYSGDTSSGGHNLGATSTCGDEPLTLLDASITITPQTATNAVGVPHVFTVTASVLPAGTHLDGATITTSVSPTLATQSTTCGSPTLSGSTATCTVTITGTSVATYTVNAAAALTVGSLTIHRSTDGTSGPHGPGGSGPATKNYVDASVAIAPSAVNEVGHSHTFTVTVTALPGNAGTPAFTSITPSVAPAPSSQSTTCNAPSVSGNVATCTLTIDSTSAGTFTANAAAVVTIDGVALDRSTDPTNPAGDPHGPGGSGPAVKTYVDASVSIAQSAVNEVNQQHVFTVTVTAYPSGASPVTFGTITPTVTPVPGTVSDTCGTPTINGNIATCTVTINSALPNTFEANVSAQVTMGGVTVTRSTAGNSGPGGSGPATKIYVDASVGISSSAVNEVGHPHTFTITVTALPSTATPVVFTSITPSVTPAPSSQSSTCATPTVNGDVATCTVTLNSTTAGTFTVNAAAVVTMGGVAVSRSTSGDSGPGGTGPSTKTFVDAAVAIGPSAVNAVGQEHTFNVTVTAIPGGASPVAFGTITPSVTPAPGTMATTCGSPTISGNVATCTVTIDSATAGTFTANVSANVTMGGVTVTRSTAAGGNAGPGGSGPAVKTYVDASVAISPHTAVNEVGNAHTFTVTVTAIPSGATPVAFTSITPSVSPAPTSQSSTCDSPTVNGDVATCTVTLDSSSAGTFTINADAVVTMGGASVTRSTSTNSGPGGSGPATKTFVDASVTIGPPTALNVVGAPHTFTITVTAIPGGATPVSFGTVTPSVTPAPTTLSTTCDAPAISGDVATCTVTIDSSTAGTYTANVSAQVTMGGVTVTRSTAAGGNAGPGGSGPAVKVYGLATIGIAPSAVNEVGHAHTFTVTVTSVPGATTSFTSITPTVTPQPDSLTSTCGTPVVTANVATCTVTIDSATAGVFTASATAHLVVNSFATSVTTDGSAGNSGPATKTYVDASIAIAPTAVNEVGHSHTFTITVTALPAGSPAATFTSITPTVTPAPDSTTSTCDHPAVSGNVATCTVTIDNSGAGVFTANAAAVLIMGGVTLDRSTDGSAGPAGPTGSGSAVKTYVDAAVGIGPSAVNPIGKEHVFDIVVTAIPAGAAPVVFGAIVPSVSPAPLTSSTTCATPTVTGDRATCTLTVNNDLPASFTANVTATVTMGGVSVTRSTAENHGPGGTGPATKTYVSANIQLTPIQATDPVGDHHVLTATVTVDDSTGQVPAPDGTVVDVSIVSGPGTLSAPSCTTAGGTGTCTVTLTSPVAGTTTMQATTTLAVRGVSLTRTTGDSVPGDGPDAVKNWVRVTPAIATVPSAGGNVGTAVHDTATVTGGLNPTGTVTFQLFSPADTTCTQAPVFTSAQATLVDGAAVSLAFTPTSAGTYHWVATYNGDAANVPVTSGCGEEPVTLTPVAVFALSVPNTGVAAMGALGAGLALLLLGGILIASSRRRTGEDGGVL